MKICAIHSEKYVRLKMKTCAIHSEKYVRLKMKICAIHSGKYLRLKVKIFAIHTGKYLRFAKERISIWTKMLWCLKAPSEHAWVHIRGGGTRKKTWQTITDLPHNLTRPPNDLPHNTTRHGPPAWHNPPHYTTLHRLMRGGELTYPTLPAPRPIAHAAAALSMVGGCDMYGRGERGSRCVWGGEVCGTGRGVPHTHTPHSCHTHTHTHTRTHQ